MRWINILAPVPVLLAAACSVNVAVDSSVQVTCTETAHCPAATVCVPELGRCVSLTEDCITLDSGGAQLVPDGTPCEAGTDRICVAGRCGAPECGDGFITPPEACDDGALNSDTVPDACRRDCRLAHCGDSVIDDLEECDDGAAHSDSLPDHCRTNCRRAGCGDDVVDAGEACDDGTANSDALPNACRLDCQRAACGDGVTDNGEDCDDGDGDDGNDCTNGCRLPACGDGIVWERGLGGEQCDRTFEPCAYGLQNCLACTPLCVEVPGAVSFCGDGFIDSVVGETCDDGNSQAGDGCTDTCVVEPRFSCRDSPSRCAELFYVDVDATGAEDGTSWTDAFTTLQDALAVASNTVTLAEIWVAEGDYRPDQGGGMVPGDRTATFALRGGLELYGGFAGTETTRGQRNVAAFPTRLHGDLASDDGVLPIPMIFPPSQFANNSLILVTVAGQTTEVRLDGFTLRNAAASALLADFSHRVVVANSTFRGNGSSAAFLSATSAELSDCDFVGNHSPDGSALYAQYSDLRMLDCTVRLNYSLLNGGGVTLEVSTLDAEGVDFEDNAAGDIFQDEGQGGAIYAVNSLVELRGSNILRNRSRGNGGGIAIEDSRLVMTDSLMEGNGIDYTMNTRRGGAIWASFGGLQLVNTELRNNDVTAVAEWGGAIYGASTLIELVGCHLEGNLADRVAGIQAFGPGDLVVEDTTIVGHSGSVVGAIWTNPGLVSRRSRFYGNGSVGVRAAFIDINDSVFVQTDLEATVDYVRTTNSTFYNSDISAPIEVTAVNSIVWGGGSIASGNSVVSYSCVEGWAGGGAGNVACCDAMTCDPGFVDPAGGDMTLGTLDDDVSLDSGSVCVDAGNNDAVPPSAALDAAGAPRRADDPGVADTGMGSAPIVDMGGLERSP